MKGLTHNLKRAVLQIGFVGIFSCGMALAGNVANAVTLINSDILGVFEPDSMIGGNYEQTAAGTLKFYISSPGDWDLNITGRAMIDGNLVLDFLSGPKAGDMADISVIASAGLTGDFSQISVEGLSGPFSQTVSTSATDISVAIQTVPEPASILMLSAAIAGMATTLRTRRVQTARRNPLYPTPFNTNENIS